MNERELIDLLRRTRPEPPKQLAERIEGDLVRLRRGKDGKMMRRKMPMAALVAVIIAILTAFGAIAATVAGSLLKDRLNAGGAGDAASRVQEVHAEESRQGFSFTVEQCYWEGGTLCLSYRATVPEDGRQYLLGLEMPELNGERLRGPGYYMDDELSGYLLLLGGERMTTLSEIRRLTAYANQVRAAGNRLTLRASFMTPNRPVKWVSGEKYQRLLGEGAYTYELPEDGFFYIDADQSMPVLGLAELKPVQAYWSAHEDQRLRAGDLQQLGLVRLEQTLEVTVDVDDARYDGPTCRGVTPDIIQFDGFAVEMTGFELTHLNCAMRMTVTPDAGVDIADVPTDFALYLPDGSPLLADGREWISFAWPNATGDGVAGYNVRCEATGILAIGGAESLMLVPTYCDPETGDMTPDLDNAAAISPTEAPIDGNADAVWATERGNYYHRDRYCMGMEGASETTVEAARDAGKQPCPVCIG